MQKQILKSQLKCFDCDQKEILIDKYLSLIELLKKKMERSMLSSTLKKSIIDDVGTTSITQRIPQNIKFNKFKLIYIITEMEKRRKTESITNIQWQNHRKNIQKTNMLVHIFQKKIQKVKRQDFQTLKSFFSHKTSESKQNQSQFDLKKNRSQLVSTHNQKFQNNFRQLLKKQSLTKLNNQELLQKNIKLREEIEENIKRYENQTKKKKESLQMLAEEMEQKDEVIDQLKTALKIYQAKQYKEQNKILEEDSFTIKKQLQRLQNINVKINLEIERKNSYIQTIEKSLTELKDSLKQLSTQNQQLKEKNFDLSAEIDSFIEKKDNTSKISLWLERKIKNVKTYEKKILQRVKYINEKIETEDRSNQKFIKDFSLKLDKKISDFNEMQNRYKIQKILNYLYNIESQDYWINNNQNLFDEQEFKVLNELKLKYIFLNEQINTFQNQNKKQKVIDITKGQQNMRYSKEAHPGSEQIYLNNQDTGSLYQVFPTAKDSLKESEKESNKSKFECKNCREKVKSNVINQSQQQYERTNSRMDKNFTVKLLELEIEKNKQIQKISELKNNLFHIRNIILNLMKSIEIKTQKTETRDILDLLFQIFQYSEEEKELIFKKEKKFFGFF